MNESISDEDFTAGGMWEQYVTEQEEAKKRIVKLATLLAHGDIDRIESVIREDRTVVPPTVEVQPPLILEDNSLDNSRYGYRIRKSPITVRDYTQLVRRITGNLEKPVTVEGIKTYLREARNHYSPDHYSVHLSALKAYLAFKGFKGALQDFKHPRRGFVPPKTSSLGKGFEGSTRRYRV